MSIRRAQTNRDATDPKALAAARWFGYGRWDAPFWFVGKEPGGVDDPEQYASWQRLGGTELIDCRDHDVDCAASGPCDWHGPEPGPNLQSTWRPLIAMLLAYDGSEEWDEHKARRYQDESWGQFGGNTAVLELSAIAARSVSQTQALRLTHLPERIATFRQRLAESPPKFVVFCGIGRDPIHNVSYVRHWSEIAQHDLSVDEPIRIGKTVFVVERHPTAPGTTTHHWTALGHRIREMVADAETS